MYFRVKTVLNTAILAMIAIATNNSVREKADSPLAIRRLTHVESFAIIAEVEPI
jgi:hypothetical protein